MKTLLLLFCCFVSLSLQAQSPSSSAGSDRGYSVVERGPHHRVVQAIIRETNDISEISIRTNSYVELATGMHYLENGEWLESQAEFEMLPSGRGAVARRGGHKVLFAPNLNTDGAIDMETPDGKRLRSHVLGLGYIDTASGESVTIAELQDNIGQVIGKNVVLYTNAFAGLAADVRYTYRISGFEQDVILRAQPPSPDKYGLDPRTTRLEVFTEFVNPPAPTIRERSVPKTALVDEELNFGQVTISRGKAFPLNEPMRSRPVSTIKRWLTIEGRTLLIESVEYPSVRQELESLPRQASNGARKASKRMATKLPLGNYNEIAERLASSIPRRMPTSMPETTATSPTMLLAELSPPGPGYVLDYVTVDSSVHNYTFAANTTYFISDYIYLTGTTTVQGGRY